MFDSSHKKQPGQNGEVVRLKSWHNATKIKKIWVFGEKPSKKF
jgi:hypothetical protein